MFSPYITDTTTFNNTILIHISLKYDKIIYILLKFIFLKGERAMFKENLLDISEKIQIEILKKLYLNNGTFCKYNLCSDLNISFPTLKLYIKNINLMFLKNYNNTINIFIDKENLILKSDIDISLDNFISIYIENSLKYKLLSLFFYYENLNSIILCKDLNISLSTLNRKIKECNKLLNEFKLEIKNFKLKGSPLQISYFYYSFFRNCGVKKQLNDIPDNENLIKFLEEIMSIDFTFSQSLSIFIWSKIIMKQKFKFTKENFLDEFSLSNLDKLKDDMLFKNLELFYLRFSLNKINNKYLAYATTCFLKSLGILSFNNETNKTLPYIVYKFILSEIKSLFLNKDFKFNNTIKSNILAFCNKQFYFRGIFYSIDKNTKDFYLNNHLSFLKENFLINLFENIQKHFKWYDLDLEYFKLLITLNLSYINEESNYTIKIGVLSKTEDLILKILLRDFNDFLKRKFNATAEIFSKKNLYNYDLILTNIHDHFLDGINIPIYRFTCLGVKYDLDNIIKFLNIIEKEKIQNIK